jgi:hypothetical protein
MVLYTVVAEDPSHNRFRLVCFMLYPPFISRGMQHLDNKAYELVVLSPAEYYIEAGSRTFSSPVFVFIRKIVGMSKCGC